MPFDVAGTLEDDMGKGNPVGTKVRGRLALIRIEMAL
jgi:hypothetical protein